MKRIRFYIQTDKLPTLLLFGAGALLGILGVYVGRDFFLANSEILREDILYNLKYVNVDCKAFFYYVVKERVGHALILAVLSSTYLGIVLCAGTALGYGVSMGVFLATAVLRYGLKGVILVVVCAFPHYALYIPMLFALLVWCERLCRGIYFQRNFHVEKGIAILREADLMRLVIILGIILVGCFLESFLNPYLLSAYLKIF